MKLPVPEGITRYQTYDHIAVNSKSKGSDPLKRHCLIHGRDYVNCGYYSTCPACRIGGRKK